MLPLQPWSRCPPGLILTLPSLPADFYSEAAPLRSRRAMAAARPLSACVHRSRARARADARGRGAGRAPPQVRWGPHVRYTVPGTGRGGVLTPGRPPTPAGAAFALDQRPLASNSQRDPRGLPPDRVLVESRCEAWNSRAPGLREGAQRPGA